MNVEFYKSLIPYCEKFGIKVACENMWQNNSASGAITDSTCSRAWEFCKYIDAVTGDIKNVSNGTLTVPSIGQGNLRVYVCCASGFQGISGRVCEGTAYLK